MGGSELGQKSKLPRYCWRKRQKSTLPPIHGEEEARKRSAAKTFV